MHDDAVLKALPLCCAFKGWIGSTSLPTGFPGAERWSLSAFRLALLVTDKTSRDENGSPFESPFILFSFPSGIIQNEKVTAFTNGRNAIRPASHQKSREFCQSPSQRRSLNRTCIHFCFTLFWRAAAWQTTLRSQPSASRERGSISRVRERQPCS